MATIFRPIQYQFRSISISIHTKSYLRSSFSSSSILPLTNPLLFPSATVSSLSFTILRHISPSTTKTQRRYKSTSKTPPQDRPQYPKNPVQPSYRTIVQELPKDIGLLPYTFIQPTGKNLPSLFSNPKERYRLLLKKLKYKFKTLQYLVVYRFQTRTPLYLFEPKHASVPLYKDMYTAYADGDLTSLRLLCNDGLYDTFRRNIQARPPVNKQRQVWKLHTLVGRPKVVANQAIVVPQMGVGMRQAVVKIKSIQSLSKFDYKGALVPGTGVPKPVTEYVVLQRRKGGKTSPVGPWTVWGTTQETTLEVLEEMEKNPIWQSVMA